MGRKVDSYPIKATGKSTMDEKYKAYQALYAKKVSKNSDKFKDFSAKYNELGRKQFEVRFNAEMNTARKNGKKSSVMDIIDKMTNRDIYAYSRKQAIKMKPTLKDMGINMNVNQIMTSKGDLIGGIKNYVQFELLSDGVDEKDRIAESVDFVMRVFDSK